MQDLTTAASTPAAPAVAAPEAKAAGEITGWTATQLSQAIQSRSVSCVEVMNAYLVQIDRLNPKVNAIVSLQPREGLLAQAAERDAQLARGQRLGWMHGFPQAPKDLAATAGIVTTSGSPILKDYVPKSDAIVVERARRCRWTRTRPSSRGRCSATSRACASAGWATSTATL